MNNPSISVLMSCYNAEKWLPAAIDSVLVQSYTDFEFIILNDGSTDTTLSIVRAYGSKDSRIVILDKPNTGLADSLNCGIRVARGRWIARIDADDLCDPLRLEKQLKFVLENPDIVLLGSGFREIDVHNIRVKDHYYPGKSRQLIRRLERLRGFFPHSSAFFRLDIAKQLGGYRTEIKRAEDWDLWLRFSERGNIACLADLLVLIRKHNEQISNEEGGFRQLIDVHIATVSYFLRRLGIEDPMTSIKNVKASEFRNWVEKCMVDNDVYKRRCIWGVARSKFFMHRNRIIAISEFILHIIRSGYAFSLCKEKLLGSYYPEKLAKEYVRLL